MLRLLTSLLLLTGSFQILRAQPFDTLLSQYNSISEIFPLKDSTFILIGTGGNNILVERINQKAEVIWTLPVVSYEKDYLDDFRYDINSEDSVFQLATSDKGCDYFNNSLHKAFTIDLHGKLLDSQSVSFGNEYGNIFLLSALPNRPRLAYLDEEKIVIMDANGDTIQLQLSWSNGDTTNSDLIGTPSAVTMCPNGDIIVGTNSLFYFRFSLENNRYVVVDESYGIGYQRLICLDEQFIILANDHYLELRSDQFSETYFNPVGSIRSATWRDPNLAVHVFHFGSPDTVYFLNNTLELVYKEPIDHGGISTLAIQDSITYKVGSGNIYFDHGLLLSEHQVSHQGPKYYDVELVDFLPGPYAEVSLQYGFGNYYLYDIPHATVTIKNNCDYVLDNLVIHYGRTVSFCSDTIWERELTSMDLQPGETQTFDLYDIFIGIGYPKNRFEEVCIYAIRPDHHYDDDFDDNELCKDIDLLPLAIEPSELPIHHNPSVISEFIIFLSPEEIDFELTIYSSNGVPVYTGPGNTYSADLLDLSFLPAGLYLFQYTITGSETRYVEKILKY